MATPPQGKRAVDVDSISKNVNCLRIGYGVLRETPKSQCSRRSRGIGAKRTLFTGANSAHGAAMSVSGLSTPSSSHLEGHQFPPWTLQEDQALVAFMLLYTEATFWNSRAGKGDQFWKKAGEHVQRTVNSVYCRTGKHPFAYISFSPYYVLETVVTSKQLEER